MINDTYIASGAKLKEIRKSKNLSSFKVAKETGTSRRYIKDMEKGLVTPPDTLLIALEDLYKEPIFKLFSRIRPADIDEIMKHPALRKLCVEVTTDKNALSQDNLDGIYDELKEIYNNHYKEAD